ncbi:PREDICTED: U-box domain-containing protein 52-like [Nelumbo nucifera]|uniref:UspA domain-containing protein n=2 Tax=Nelumbo nucifera TaxID=4432 RepID=A0A822YQP5_NELNU|nr:PREDICTED: U-box domain-containing protein 52-like [Nelumbo nucifera]DAD34453.1 TPA_asm: hypothetical protein HUJ06_005093 [Nelumbo nucifera]
MEEENIMSPSEEEERSPEIVELGEGSEIIVTAGSRNEGSRDVYVAVGKNDLDVLKWALDHVVSQGARLYLIHVFPPINYIPTPVGRVAKSQMSQEHVKEYIQVENTRREYLLQKYIRLCRDAKVAVDTMLIESDHTAKAILELIPVLNITNLVMGTKRTPSSRRSRKGLGKSEFVQKNAPEFCEVNIVFGGRKVVRQRIMEMQSSPPSSRQKPEITRNAERSFFECVCFSAKSN